MKLEESCVARRRFLAGMIAGGGTALGAGAAVPLFSYVADLKTEPPPDFLEIAKADYDLAPGKSNMIEYGRIPVLLLRTPGPNSVLKVFVATCTHFDCPVGYQEEGNYILCACHDGRYNIEGGVTGGPPPAPLRQFHMKFRGDTLIIALEKENLEKAHAET